MTSTGAFGFATAQIHAGQEPDRGHGSRITPIHLTAGFVFDDLDQARDRFAGDDDGYTYTRYGNPTIAAVERKIAALEGGVEAIAVGSGQAAASVALLALLRAGDHLLSARSIYEGSRGLFRDNFERFGIEVDFVDDANDPDAWRRLVRPTTRAFFGESIPNPRNDLLDLRLVASVADEVGVPLVIDNTLATPYLVRPIEHGASIVIHSASKFLAGHGASLGGVIVDSGRFDWTRRPDAFPHLAHPDTSLRGISYAARHGERAYAAYARSVIASRLGPTLSPFNAFLLQQGIETLSLRIERHSSNAAAIATWLEQRPEVLSVDYSGLASSPHAELARTYLPRGQGSVFSFTLRGGEDAAARFIEAVRLFTPMSHLGDVRSLVLHPATTSHGQLSADERTALGIADGMLRLSIGIEDLVDLLADLEVALTAAGSAPVAHVVHPAHAVRVHAHHLQAAALR